ncbi:TPA: multidrug efflux RND transporter permease subunit [Legionella pneumophila subsp. pneumophila]|uniref:Efflux pump membrane transporter n=4 Tax=Legionella pneumophila TaxID=446 RepID=A0A378KB56_LEGPN|nr:multidrug efflux RND transporter permease subunit [Legionella pneumophila]ABQ55888.1 RND multidrug efflux transporter MexF [Legionella pneumophila str. Corby]ADG25901.1 RND multidrug efflux transporter Mex [Legionella pneumophila 2300/99 Alcoy]MCO1451812.1 multidrug efflux RND transporter permease subunit [Legionella pneumophila]MCW8403384.1 multidrug efflux RND transporter permease subunit [Legionella pneumophila]MCW8435910.1 multidrug efflux RND transporter permease subunit [Legionella pn
MISKFFIERPVLANVIALFIVFIGIIAIAVLPVSQYPAIVPPTIQVTTSYPGADAKTLINTVALPIEQQVNGVEDMLYMQSTSTSGGTYTLIVTFAIGTDLNYAQVLVQNRVQAAMAQLPESVQKQGVVVQQKSTAILQFITLTSKNDEYDGVFLDSYATINMQDELSRLPGVGNVVVFGSGSYAMRVWLDPKKMLAFSLNPSDVLNAISYQNKEVSAGQLGAPPTVGKQAYQFTVNVPGQLSDPKEFENIIIKTIDTSPDENSSASSSAQVVRIRDVGRVELGSESYNQLANLNGKPTAAIGIFQLPGANALDVAQEVRKAVAKMAKQFPPGLEYSIPFDTTVFVKASIEEVYKTLFEAGILVLIVIVVFLQNFRASLVPATTVPVTIIGTFFAMLLLGYSINLLTLFALVLAIGIVVDDAIVIVEGVTQHIEKGMSPKESAILAMKELFGPIIGITLVLMAVFVPAGFMPGLTGSMYAQFALVIAATAFISAINAMTLKPTQCALWLKAPDTSKPKNIFFQAFDRIYNPIESAYVKFIDRLVHRSGKVCLIGIILVACAIYGLTRIPTGFIPMEDQGYLMLSVQLPDGASLGRTDEVVSRLAKKASEVGGVDNVISIDGISLLDNNSLLPNAGVIYVIFKDWSVRGKSENLRALYTKFNAMAKETLDAKVLVVVPPPIQGLGMSGGFQMQVELQDGTFDYRKLQQATDQMINTGHQYPQLQNLMTTFRASVPQVAAPINRTKAESLGVRVADAFDTLQTYLGSSYVNLFTKFGQVFPVYVQADASSRVSSEDLRNYYVRNQSGSMVPLGTLTDVGPAVGPSIISLYNLYPSSNINGVAARGYSSGQGIQVMEELAKEQLPPGISYEWTSTAYQEKVAGNLSYFIFALSLVLVYLILSGQYENWLIPSAIILSVPLTLVGTVLALGSLGMDNNMYTQIGLLLLIALATKNAILIVEVAREQREIHNKSVLEAAVIGAKTRFRPILMTSFAFIMGVMPLVFATGAGANSRRSIGIAVSSGMLASTCLAVVFVPVFYVLLQTWQDKRKAKH